VAAIPVTISLFCPAADVTAMALCPSLIVFLDEKTKSLRWKWIIPGEAYKKHFFKQPLS